MREKLAKALDNADVHSMGWKERAIDAVLDAMREPDDDQLIEAQRTLVDLGHARPVSNTLRIAYRAMIDAAR